MPYPQRVLPVKAAALMMGAVSLASTGCAPGGVAEGAADEGSLVLTREDNEGAAVLSGSGFSGGGVWLSGWCSHSGATFGQVDFNGDGRAELWCHDPINGASAGNPWVALSTGSGFSGGGVWLSGWCSHSGATFGQADFNGDGRADLWCHDPINGASAGNTWVALSTGSGFSG